MTVSSIPRYNRLLSAIDGEWSDWQEQFAWYPRKLKITEYETVPFGQAATLSYRKDTVYRWIWLKKYWRRSRLEHTFIDTHGYMVYDEDYAFDLLDIIRKS